MNPLRKEMSDGRHLVPLNSRDEEERDAHKVTGWIVAWEDRPVRDPGEGAMQLAAA